MYKIHWPDQSKSVMELVHADLCGPFPIESLNGSRYFLIIVDDFSGMYFTYFLKNKSECLDNFSFKV